MEKYNVVYGWTASYDSPITLKKDEKVIVDLSIKETEPEWVGCAYEMLTAIYLIPEKSL